MPAACAVLPGRPPETFSTAGLPVTRRVEMWEDHNAAALIGLSCQPADQSRFAATEVNLQVGRVHLARVTGSPHSVRRSSRTIRQNPAEAVAVYLTLRGTAWFEQQEVTRSLRPGHALICDADQPFTRGFARGLEELAIKVPRAALAELASAELAAGEFVTSPVVADFSGGAGTSYHARALARLAGQATRRDHSVPADERTILELVAVLAAGRGASPALAHRAAARGIIEERLADPELSAPRIAAAIGVSERQLSRVFAADGTSVPRHILRRRLERAYALLIDPADRSQTIADVAARCGFTSAAYFSHGFREHFGERASDVRASHFRHSGRAG